MMRWTAGLIGSVMSARPADVTICSNQRCWRNRARLLSGSGVVPGPSRNQACDERAEQGFAASARAVHELEEAEIKRQLVLRDAPVRAKPRAQQRPKPLHRVDVHLAEPVAVLVAGILASGVADRLVLVQFCAGGGAQ